MKGKKKSHSKPGRNRTQEAPNPRPQINPLQQTAFRAEIRKAVHRVVGETGRKGGGILYSYIYI